MCTIKRVNVTTYLVLISYRHFSELGHLVLSTCIPMGLFTLKFVANCCSCSVELSSVRFVCREQVSNVRGVARRRGPSSVRVPRVGALHCVSEYWVGVCLLVHPLCQLMTSHVRHSTPLQQQQPQHLSHWGKRGTFVTIVTAAGCITTLIAISLRFTHCSVVYRMIWYTSVLGWYPTVVLIKHDNRGALKWLG